jgi:hypothetical protein
VDEILGYAGISTQSSQPSRLRSPYECTRSTSLRTDTTAKQRTTARLYSQSPHDGTPPTGPGGVSVGSVGVCGTVAGWGAGNPALWDSPRIVKASSMRPPAGWSRSFGTRLVAATLRRTVITKSCHRGHGGHDQTGNRQPRGSPGDVKWGRQCCQRGQRGQNTGQHGLPPAPHPQRRRPAHQKPYKPQNPLRHKTITDASGLPRTR